MIYLTEATYPGTKAIEAAKVWLEFMKTNPPPDYVKIIDLYAHAGGDGYRVLLLHEIGKGKEEEGIQYVSKGTVQLLNNIEGYKIEAHVVYNMADAFEFLGMNAPAV
jgi:hypothetical protein